MDILSFVLGYNKGKAQGGSSITAEIKDNILYLTGNSTVEIKDNILYLTGNSTAEIKDNILYLIR